jgi:hypothetical protein
VFIELNSALSCRDPSTPWLKTVVVIFLVGWPDHCRKSRLQRTNPVQPHGCEQRLGNLILTVELTRTLRKKCPQKGCRSNVTAVSLQARRVYLLSNLSHANVADGLV